ncbi:MAG: response regulator transcription factor [Chloroflexi bacterium]|nr:response regulator transcription factor [Chloroflexota bacterium]MCH8095140.1 response regulator transcription factor [Chloroflexota bacterium]MCH8339544.1 response regulator transcription factor [Chloroflexota bacterium]MCH8342178.1 response regulator transcription factor [Chloroflexota bacterium]MDK1045882.1 response regulator transcription factor [Anaerolineales bacterium]
MTTESVVRILVADDHPVVRDGLVAMLSTQTDFRVVGQASTGREVVANIEIARPDVVLLDLEMPDLDGVEALRQVTAEHPEVKVLVFTAFDDDERIVSAVQAGAQGYLLKGSPRDKVFDAIRVISQGGSLLQPVVASKLMRHVSSQGVRSRLTARELEALDLLANGMTNKEIAAELVITVRTVKFHVSSILRKLEAGNRTEAVRIAAERGIIDLQQDR